MRTSLSALSSGRYLVEDPEREREAVWRLLDLTPIADRLFNPLGLSPGFSWFITELQYRRIADARSGDVDILGGRLEWTNPAEFEALFNEERRSKLGWHPTNVAFLAALRMANQGGIKWPPSTAWLVAIEAKCAYLSPDADSISEKGLKSTKASPRKVARMRKQVNALLRFGFNRVALLDVIGNPPVTGLNGQAWLTAACLAADSRRAMSRILKMRLSPDSPSGHYVWSIGAVAGGHEGMRGSDSLEEVRSARDNPSLSEMETAAQRSMMEEHLTTILAELPKPQNLRVIFTDCRRCGAIHSIDTKCSL